MTEVAFEKYNFRIEEQQGAKVIFDEVRKKWVSLSPEEWVRQHVLHYLIHTRNYPRGLVAVERGIELNGLQKRFDIVVFTNNGHPKMIIECKAPHENLNEKVFEQIARYNLSLRVDYLWVSNGTLNYCCRLKDRIALLKAVPDYEEMMG